MQSRDSIRKRDSFLSFESSICSLLMFQLLSLSFRAVNSYGSHGMNIFNTWAWIACSTFAMDHATRCWYSSYKLDFLRWNWIYFIDILCWMHYDFVNFTPDSAHMLMLLKLKMLSISLMCLCACELMLLLSLRKFQSLPPLSLWQSLLHVYVCLWSCVDVVYVSFST